MNNSNILEKPLFRFYLESGADFITMEWSGYANSQEFRKGTEQMLEELRQNGLQKVLADVRDMILIAAEDQAWVQHDFVPRALQEGFKAIALVQPLHYFNKVAVESLAYKLRDVSLDLRIFSDAAEARQWLAGR